MTRRRLALLLFAAALLALPAIGARAADSGGLIPVEEKSLLAPDGTLYVVRAGFAGNLGIAGGGISPSSFVIEWTSRSQDGTVALGVVPDTEDQNVKSNLDLAYDELSGSLVLLWKEQISILNYLHLAVFRGGVWTQTDLLPNLGFFQAYNPRMLLAHQTVKYQNADGNAVAVTRSILSIIWWEESQYAQARYAPIFLDEDLSASDVKIYDLPATIGGAGAVNYGVRNPGSYMYPALQFDGSSGAILASFADLNADRQFVLRITYPDDLGRSGPTNATWLRRRIPVVGVTSEGPIADTPAMQYAVSTVIGASYKPTLLWRADNAVGYTRFDGKKWSSVKTIPLDDSMSYDRALRLVEEMATKN
jgi:hypothetical protein